LTVPAKAEVARVTSLSALEIQLIDGAGGYRSRAKRRSGRDLKGTAFGETAGVAAIMKVEKLDKGAGVTVNLEPAECELFVRLALDAQTAAFQETANSYLSLSLTLGKGILDLRQKQTRVLIP
jgi:hypothetical protein